MPLTDNMYKKMILRSAKTSILKRSELRPRHFLNLLSICDSLETPYKFLINLDFIQDCNCFFCNTADFSRFPMFFSLDDLDSAVLSYYIFAFCFSV